MITSLTIGYLLPNVSYSIRLKFASNVFKQKASQVSFCKIKIEHQARSYGFPKTCSSPKYGVEPPPSSFRAPARESNKRSFNVRCPVMESNFGLFRFEPRLCHRSFRVKIQGSKPEKPGFHLASCKMQLLVNYTKHYTAAIFTRK